MKSCCDTSEGIFGASEHYYTI